MTKLTSGETVHLLDLDGEWRPFRIVHTTRYTDELGYRVFKVSLRSEGGCGATESGFIGEADALRERIARERADLDDACFRIGIGCKQALTPAEIVEWLGQELARTRLHLESAIAEAKKWKAAQNGRA